MKLVRILVIAIGLSTWLSACEDQTQEAALESNMEGVKAIQWHKGSVEDAFAIANEQAKPLFFYWGAEWCPPCQEINNTVFNHPKFVSQSELFIPVYLDGDTEQAQIVGERFTVKGYPTMIVFDADGEELTRIPGGIDTRRYLDVLSLSLSNGNSINALIKKAQGEPQQLSDAELTQLAFYSWGQDNIELNEDDRLSVLKQLALLDSSKNPMSVSRLVLTYLATQIDFEKDSLTQAEKLQFADKIATLLKDGDLVLANVDYLSFYPREIVELLNLDEESSADLVELWQSSLAQQRDNTVLSKAERLGTLLAPVHFYWMQSQDSKMVNSELAQSIVAMVETMNNNTMGDERQSVINRAGNVLRAANLYEEAKQLITAEINISKSPYYFMSSMAEIAEETDDVSGIVEWRKKAYEAADGRATRFQWGVEYASALIDFAPQETNSVQDHIDDILGHVGNEELFSGRNLGRLKTLLSKLEGWENTEQATTYSAFVTKLDTLCENVVANNTSTSQCSEFLASL